MCIHLDIKLNIVLKHNFLLSKSFKLVLKESKSRSGVNFINVLCTAFTLVDPKSVKKIDNLTVFFTLLGSARVKAVRRTLVKLTPGDTLLNPLRTLECHFLFKWTLKAKIKKSGNRQPTRFIKNWVIYCWSKKTKWNNFSSFWQRQIFWLKLSFGIVSI